MADEATPREEQKPLTLDEIAASMLVNPQAEAPVTTDEQEARSTPAPREEPAADLEVPVEEPETDQEPSEAEATEEPEEQVAGEEDFEDDIFDFIDTPEDPEVEDPEPEEGDDQSLQFKVDGEIVDMTMAEVRQQIALGKATEKRLKEATEMRSRAIDEGMDEARTKAVEILGQVQQQADVIRQTYERLDGALFAPMIEQPTVQLAQTDPVAFAQQQEAFQADQARIAQQRQELQQVGQLAEEVTQQRNAQVREQEYRKLQMKVPAIKDPERAKAYYGIVTEGATGVGFTAEEIAAANDHRLFLMAAEAAAFRRMKAAGVGQRRKSAKTPSKGSQKRTIPPGAGRGGGRRKKSVQVARERERESKMAKARETGSVDDIAATLY